MQVGWEQLFDAKEGLYLICRTALHFYFDGKRSHEQLSEVLHLSRSINVKLSLHVLSRAKLTPFTISLITDIKVHFSLKYTFWK